ncbi:MAG: endonuclease III [Clostridium sp.]|nr:endonuclease III [Clostridium sp.]
MKFLLVALNAQYVHTSLAIRCLATYVEPSLHEHIELVEYTINQAHEQMLEDLIHRDADVVGFSCYIWNISMIESLIIDLHQIRPMLPIWLGGPEVSYDADVFLKKHPFLAGIIRGEGEVAFQKLLRRYLEVPKEQWFQLFVRALPQETCTRSLDELPFPYTITASHDATQSATIPSSADTTVSAALTRPDTLTGLSSRILYYESSRGCPYHCAYCLSGQANTVRFRDTSQTLVQLRHFLAHQCTLVKFVDRTFNANPAHARAIWQFIKDYDNGVTSFHFEISGELLDETDLAILGSMRPGLCQLEIGVQSANPQTLRAIGRSDQTARLFHNISLVHALKTVPQHLDLIAGLPYEDYTSFGRSFDSVYRLHPNQLQLGFLKVLKGSPLATMVEEWGIRYSPAPPYEVLETSWLSYEDLLALKRVCRALDLYYNSAQFTNTLTYLEKLAPTPFSLYEALGQDLHEHSGDGHPSSRQRRYEQLLTFVEMHYASEVETMRERLTFDYYLREKPKARPTFAPSLADAESVIRAFYEKEAKDPVLLSDYVGYTATQVRRMTHVERLGGVLYLFDYRQRDPFTHNAHAIPLLPVKQAPKDDTEVTTYEDTASENTASEYAASKDAASKDSTSRDSTSKAHVQEVLSALEQAYGRDIACYLDHDAPWQLLIATILSAQCTDARVNLVTKDLFKQYPTVEALAGADPTKLEDVIRPTGFYHNKAKNIIACCRVLLTDHGGEVPSSIEDLTRLPGVGRKTANVILGNIYQEPSIVVDTHVKRISRRLGWTNNQDPAKIEADLCTLLPREYWIFVNLWLIALGRSICKAPNPKCSECFLTTFCPNFSSPTRIKS